MKKRINDQVREILADGGIGKAGLLGAGATEESRAKAEELYAALSDELKIALLEMGPWDLPATLTRMFGNESEKAGMQFGLFPLWVGIVEEMLKGE